MKKWYLSKVFWINVIAIGALIVRSEYGLVMTPEAEITLLGIINIILRAMTHEEIKWF